MDGYVTIYVLSWPGLVASELDVNGGHPAGRMLRDTQAHPDAATGEF